MKIGKSIVPLNDLNEAFDLFNQLLVPAVIDVKGEEVRFDIGDYVHIMGDEERLRRIRWIKETLTNPIEIRRSHLKSAPFREVYINVIHRDEYDELGEPFIVGVDRRAGILDFRTAFVPRPRYLENAKRAKLIWRTKN
jgi:hypothetical protein